MDDAFRVVFLGNKNVGKTSLCKSLANNANGVANNDDVYTLRDGDVSVLLIDTGGMETMRDLTSTYYRGSHMHLLCYDITNKDSFTDLNFLLLDCAKYSQHAEIVVVACKQDLMYNADIAAATITEWLDTRHIDCHISCSAMDGCGIQELLQVMKSKAQQRYIANQSAFPSSPRPLRSKSIVCSRTCILM